MKTKDARELGQQIAAQVDSMQIEAGYALLAPVLAQRTPFPLLGLIGEAVGGCSLELTNAFLERVAAERTEGGWVVIGMALNGQLDRDPAGAFTRCREYVIMGDVWYTADILSERVPGPALLTDFDQALSLLESWRTDPNYWVRRTVGIAAHFWAKRSCGTELDRAKRLLNLLEPMFGEWEMDVVKGVGWGLKTLGRSYPELMVDWLAQEVRPAERRHRALMLNKALTFLSPEQKRRALGESG